MYITKTIGNHIMSSGHASHKGSSTKPDLNTNGIVNADPDNSIADTREIQPGAPIPGRTKEGQENSTATERSESPES
jgi:hypothetical protein